VSQRRADKSRRAVGDKRGGMKMEILLAVVPPYIGEYPQPEQYASRDLMDKQGVSHRVPPPMGRNVAMPSIPYAGNLSASGRYTTN
jgi:hypothetical protein